MSDCPFPTFKYTGSALPGNAESVTLVDTTTFPGAKFLQGAGIHRIIVGLVNDQAGTLKASISMNRGTTWTQIVADQAVAAAAANSENINDYLLEQYPDWRLVWTNGATPQTTFIVNIAGEGQRVVGN